VVAVTGARKPDRRRRGRRRDTALGGVVHCDPNWARALDSIRRVVRWLEPVPGSPRWRVRHDDGRSVHTCRSVP